MIRVKNKKVIGRLSYKSLKANSLRNSIAILAITLTTLLFSTLFTITSTAMHSFEQQTFRQVGGDMHGTFKDVTPEQIEALSSNSLIERWGVRLMLGFLEQPPFHKSHVEISYMDAVCAKGSFAEPTMGTLPREGTNEVACDTRVLKLLKVEPVIGTPLNLTYTLGADTGEAIEQTDTFVLSGWWEYDVASHASQVVIPLSYARQVLEAYPDSSQHGHTGKWDLNIYLKSTTYIKGNLGRILEESGYQAVDKTQPNYIDVGVNWAYLGAQFVGKADLGMILGLVGLLLLIICTGYLIIYNIFHISVTQDIQFYGLLKTIGTTSHQIHSLLLRQVFMLSGIGIPIGLLLGYLGGNILAPFVMANLSYKNTYTSLNPWIFIGASLFSLFTVFLSCYKPSRIAGKVSPIEAIRYTGQVTGNKRVKKTKGGAKLHRMALSNLNRNKRKTILVVLSLSLAVVLLQVTYTFTKGVDMDKYMAHFSVCDFVLGHTDYFQTGGGIFSQEQAVNEETIRAMEEQGGITEAGKVYGDSIGCKDFVTKERYRRVSPEWLDDGEINELLKCEEYNEEGLIAASVDLYGMEAFPLTQLEVIDGDLAPLFDSTQKVIAAVYHTDDYDQPKLESNWANVGDTVTLRHVKEWEYYDIRTGKVLSEESEIEGMYWGYRSTVYEDVAYKVVACVKVPSPMSFRYYGSDAFVLNSEVFKEDTGKSDVMVYLANTTKESNAQMEAFLQDYTEKNNPDMDFESKKSCTDVFEEFKGMFELLGGILSGIIALVGILNFLNASLTSILARKREFAMLQSIGMTGRQLKGMLILEGLYYIGFTTIISLSLSMLMGSIMKKGIGEILWFFTYHFTLLPVFIILPIYLVLGIMVPLGSYHVLAKQTVVERLREVQ